MYVLMYHITQHIDQTACKAHLDCALVTHNSHYLRRASPTLMAVLKLASVTCQWVLRASEI